jgi:hypothetical protein
VVVTELKRKGRVKKADAIKNHHFWRARKHLANALVFRAGPRLILSASFIRLDFVEFEWNLDKLKQYFGFRPEQCHFD